MDRSDIISAALDIINREGPDAISMRKVAARVNSSVTSIYYYFRNKTALVDNLRGFGFRQLENQMVTAFNSHTECEGQLIAVWTSYLDYGFNSPNLFRLMFGLCNCQVEGLDTSFEESFPSPDLAYTIQNLLREGQSDPENLSAFYMLWSLAHGLAILQSFGPANIPFAKRILQDTISGICSLESSLSIPQMASSMH